ncbi:MAG: Mbov_0395 family pilin-like conjugal transfer protein [Candidatus Saccharimonadales bacterium]
MRRRTAFRLATTFVALGMPFVLTGTALAASSYVGSVQSFIKSVIQVIAGLAGLVATGFFVFGGFAYITSSGNPEHLEKAKRTLFYSATGLAITIAAFVLSNIVTNLASNAFGG